MGSYAIKACRDLDAKNTRSSLSCMVFMESDAHTLYYIISRVHNREESI